MKDTIPSTTDLDNAVRRWLRDLISAYSKTQISFWMGYGGESGKNPSRSQLDAYLKEEENRHFKIAYIARIAEGLGISSGEALMQIYAELPREHRHSPLPGRADRQAARERARRAEIPRDLRSRSAK